MLITNNPEGIAPPVGAYSHSVSIPGNARWLSIAGQAGIRPDGTLADGFEAQHEVIWENTLAILEANDMGPENLVHLNVYSTDPTGIRFIGPHRERFLAPGHIPTSTWIVISALARPDWVLEMDAVAAKVD